MTPIRAGTTLAAVTVITVTGAAALQGVAAAAPNCGGQHAAAQPVPYTCVLPLKVIDGTGFSAVVHANGSSVTVTITLDAPRNVDTPARIVHHEGISGAGGTSDQAAGTILAGQTSITLTDSAPCREGQLDVKAVHVGNGDAAGRIGGPWIRNGSDCTPISIPTTPTTAPPSSTPGTVPTPSTPGSSTPTTGPAGTLPATGSSSGLGWVTALALVALASGFVALVLAGIRRPVR